MKRLTTIANDLLELAENVEEWEKYIDKIKNPEEDEKLQAIINDRNELISKLLLLDLETRFKYSERPSKAQTKWFKDNWGLSESTLDFYRNRKSKSISQQYNDLDNKEQKVVEVDVETEDKIETEVETNVKADIEIPNLDDLFITKNNANPQELIQSKDDKKDKKFDGLNRRSMEDNIWSNISFEHLCLLEPQYHTPYQYGDIMDDGRVYVWKNKYVDKELFFKSYKKSREFLDRKESLDLSVPEIIKRTGLSRAIVNAALYYPYIKISDMMLEQFERKYAKL